MQEAASVSLGLLLQTDSHHNLTTINVGKSLDSGVRL